MNLQDAYGKLQGTKRTHPFIVIQIPEREGLYIGVDSEDRAVVFIKAQEGQRVPSIRTEKLQVDFCAEYKLYVNGIQDITSTFHSIHCLSNEPEDTRVFIDVIESIISDPSTSFTIRSLSSIFYALVSLFETTPQQDTRKERQGLWGELFFMRHFGGYEKWISKWHSETGRLFDFTSEGKRIEIKSSTRSERIHDFSHRQLYPVGSEDIIIVSLLLREDDAGISLKSLIAEARTALRGNLHYIRLERAILNAGMTDQTQEGPKYNQAEALSAIAWYLVDNVPRFQNPEPTGVSGTHYRSDLSTVQKMSEEEVQKAIQEWSA